MSKVRVLIVDDSLTMRKMIRNLLEADPRLEVVGEAGEASEARDAVNALSPDVMTLDVEMPNMNGLEFLRRLMKHRPMPVVMVSTLTAKGSDAAVNALAIGAVDCVEKPKMGGDANEFTSLADIVHVAAHARLQEPRTTAAPTSRPSSGSTYRKICLIGGSTGAVDAIERILERFPQDCPPTLITQHMPAPFLKSFAQRLDPLVAPEVALAEDGEEIRAGRVLIAPGGDFHLNIKPGAPHRCVLMKGDRVSGHRPSVDSMFLSAQAIPKKVIATILTGMGRDGAAGMAALKNAGAVTIGQSKETCVVFGMPRVAGEMGGVSQWLPIDKIGDALIDLSK